MHALLLAALLTTAADAPPAVAMVLTVKGTVTLRRGEDPAKQLGAMDLLRPGDKLSTTPGGEAVLVFLDAGGRERIKPGAAATVGEKGCAPAEAVERQGGGRLSSANLASLRRLARSDRAGVGVLRGDPPR